MKKSKRLLAALLMMSSSTLYAGSWSQEEKALLLTSSVLHIMDWGQTLDIAKNPQKFRELNPILGEHPTTAQVNTYFIVTALLLYGLSQRYPDQRTNIFGVYTVIQTPNVGRNFWIGTRINF